jgi:rRNA maturation protein Nop10
MSDAIRDLRAYYRARIRAAQQALITLAETCPHERATKTAWSDPDNYGRSHESYWWKHRCPDCGHTWETPQ